MDLNALKEMPSWNWPKDAEAVFREVILDNTADVEDRCTAAELAGDYAVINDELSHLLLSILTSSNQPEALRASAAIALGPVLENADTMGFDDPEEALISEAVFDNVKEALRNTYKEEGTPTLIRRRVLEASVRAKEDWHRDAVTDAFSGDPDWRLTAAFCMRYVPGFDREILELLDSDDDLIHYHAVMAAGSAALGSAWPHIHAIIDKPESAEKPLLLAAIEAVANIRPDEASDLLDDLAHSADEDISEAVLDALSLTGGLEDDRYFSYDEEFY